MDKRYLSRKFQLAVAAVIAGGVFFAIGKMTAGEWATFTQWVLGLYFAGNVGAAAAAKVGVQP